MKELILKSNNPAGIETEELERIVSDSISDRLSSLKKVLLLPPDITRANSYAGIITSIYYRLLKDKCHVDIMPALGTHVAMSDEELDEMFGTEIPHSCYLVHNWRNDVVKIGEIPGDFVKKVSEGLMDGPIDVEVNYRLMDKSYDLIISIGQVVPHEVVGMANYSKNIFVGCGGKNMINSSHMLGAFYGLERIMGRDGSPVRKVFDYAETNFLKNVPLMYVLTVTTQYNGKTALNGIFAGKDRRIFESAVEMSTELNLNFVEKPIKKAVVYLDPKEFRSTWLGNKAIYRTRLAIADGGELLVLAPGVDKFGEDEANDALIRKYGYVGRERVLELCKVQEDLKSNLSAAAHLIHGSSDGRFSITYAVKKLAKEEVEGVNFRFARFEDVITRYDPDKLKDGWNTMDDGEEIYYISNPALGLWADRRRF